MSVVVAGRPVRDPWLKVPSTPFVVLEKEISISVIKKNGQRKQTSPRGPAACLLGSPQVHSAQVWQLEPQLVRLGLLLRGVCNDEALHKSSTPELLKHRDEPQYLRKSAGQSLL